MFKDENRPDDRINASVAFVEWLQTNQNTWLQSGENTAALPMLEDEEYQEMPQSFLIADPFEHYN